jgi:hypothetical protein
MPSAFEPVAANSRPRTFSEAFELWNRRLHYYLGLYLLLFVWLFAFSGLLLNHSGWAFARFWPQRKETTSVRSIQAPAAGPDLERARDIMRQLDITGEIDWPWPNREPGHLDFRAGRPGRIFDIHTDLNQNRATVLRIETNLWGVTDSLHKFSGVRIADPGKQRNWFVTRIWSFSMDALCVGLIFMVFSSYYMWYRLKQKRRLEIVVLGLGILSCSLFAAGLAWLAQIH